MDKPRTKNLTLAIDADLLDKARVLAAIRRTSVNEMVRGFLERETSDEAKQAARAEKWQKLFDEVDADYKAGKIKPVPGPLPTREELYEEVMRERGLL
ncbi:MAG: DUF6364 family protein [Pseudomonadota bacterium]